MMRGLLLAVLFAAASPALADDAEVRSMLRAARRYADEAGRKEPDAGLLLSIAKEQYRAGDAENARATVLVATGTFGSHEGPCPSSNLLVGIARVQWETGGIAEASATMRTVLDAGVRADRKEKEQCLEKLGELQADLGDMEGALTTASLIPGARKTDLYPHIAAAFGRQARWKEAAMAAGLAAPMKGDYAYYEAMARRANAGGWREAAAVMKEIGELSDGFYEYAAISAAQAGDLDEAVKIARNVKKPAFHLWWKVSLALAQHGRAAEAIRLVSSKLAKDPNGQGMALIHIADAQEQAGDATGAERTRAQSLEVSAKGDPSAHHNQRLLILAQQGRFDELASIRNDDMGWLIKMLCQNGRLDAAIKLGGMAYMVVLDGRAAEEVVLAQVRKGDVRAALKTLASMGPYPKADREKLLHEIAVAQARQGDMAGALATIGLLRPTFNWTRPAAIEAVAEAQMASADFPEPPGWIAGLPDADEKARAWLGAARGMRLWEEASRRRR